jgi:TRAP-type C4-dicarboxylate transport system substrate-binding protein
VGDAALDPDRLIMNTTTKAPSGAILLAACACLAGCSPTLGATDKAGGPAEPSVLVMANGYSSLGVEPAVQVFVDAVEEASGGALVVRVEHEWGGLGDAAEPRKFEAHVVDSVADGDVDLAWVGTRVFDSLGVGEFRALTAPMLLDSYAAQQAVIDSDIPERMLAGLDELGVEGLAVLAGGLRKPISVDRPLLAPADWQGITFQTFPSADQSAAIEALGAQATDVLWDELDAGLAGGTIGGFEKSLLIVHINDMQVRAPYIAVNVDLWPETAALIANPDVLGALSSEQQRWVREAASAAANGSADVYDDQAVLEELCATGAIAAEATPTQLEELRTAFDPVYAELEQDPATAKYIAEILAIKSELATPEPLEVPDVCSAGT